MAGTHGKEASLLVSTNLSVVSSGSLNQLGGSTSDIYQIGDTSLVNWLFAPDNDAFKVEYQVGSEWFVVNKNHAGINYAGGAVQLPGVADASYVVVRSALRSDLVDVTHKMNQNRSWEVNFNQDQVDATVMGEFWGTNLPGTPNFTGSIDGLWLNSDKYERAVVNASGIQIRRVLRLRPSPGQNTFYQGAVRFSNWTLTASFDGPIEETLEFSGEGPLDLIKAGAPFFGPLF